MRCENCKKDISFWGPYCDFCGHDKSAAQSARIVAAVVGVVAAAMIYRFAGMGGMLMLISLLCAVGAVLCIQRLVAHQRKRKTRLLAQKAKRLAPQ